MKEAKFEFWVLTWACPLQIVAKYKGEYYYYRSRSETSTVWRIEADLAMESFEPSALAELFDKMSPDDDLLVRFYRHKQGDTLPEAIALIKLAADTF